jgi:hypothetical protein
MGEFQRDEHDGSQYLRAVGRALHASAGDMALDSCGGFCVGAIPSDPALPRRRKTAVIQEVAEEMDTVSIRREAICRESATGWLR